MRDLAIRFAIITLAFGLAMPATAGVVDPSLEAVMAETPAGETVSVLVYLVDQVDLAQTTRDLDAVGASMPYRHEMVVRSLQETAAGTQANLSNALADMQKQGLVAGYQSFWLVNAFQAEVLPEAVEQIAAHPDVDQVYLNYGIELIDPVDEGPIEEAPAGALALAPESGVQAVRAPEVWALGYTGEGITVANMDTGVQGDHPALASRWAGVADPRYAGHPEWAWYDPYAGQNNFPYDNGGHGTHTMGSVCGGPPGLEIGVAPGAQWIASAPIDRGGGIPRTVADAILSFQWMTDPDGNPSTSWDVPRVCSNSWGVTTGHGYPPCDETFWSYLDACEAAGTIIVFSAGNEGTSGLRRPPDRATDEYNTMAVAAVDANDPSWPIANFSSRGPTFCTPDGSAAIKPDISAPGVNVYSSYPGSSYRSLSGTSMASPHVNGVMALMLQANPDLSSEQVKQICYDTAVDLGSPGEDNSYGYGMIDAYEAVQVALSTVNLQFHFPNGLPDLVGPDGQTAIRVEVSGSAVQPEPGTGKLWYGTGLGGFTPVDMIEVEPNIYDAVFPVLPCGANVVYYFSAEATDGTIVTNPFSAPDVTYMADVFTDYVVYTEDNFQTDTGWTVQNSAGLTDGAWERAIPAGGGDRGDPINDADGSGYCYVTDNADDNSDVDDGYTWLISPVFDLTAADPDVEISFALWYTNNNGGDPNNDVFVIYVSNNGGSSWTTVETVGPTSPPNAWVTHSFRVENFVARTANMRVRFEASDLNEGSVVEAGIDAFSVGAFICETTPQLQACCLEDGTCSEETISDCLVAGGIPQGLDTICADVECPQPDFRNVVIGMESSVEPDDLCPGESFSVDVYLSSENGDIDDVRLLQLDTSLTSGVTVDGFTWDMEALTDMSLYLLDDEPEIVRAVYATDVGLPGFIINLNSTPQKVATVDLTFGGGSGELNLLGPGGPPGDFSVRFQADFNELNEYTATNGKVQGGVLLLSEGPCDEIMIVDSYPPDGAIDARRPHDPNDAGAREGWAMLTLEFDGDVSGLTAADFATSENGGDGTAPNVASVTPTGPTTVEVALDDIIEPLAWTTLTHVASGTSVMVGYLPADANQDGFSSTFDTLSLIDHLNAIIVLPEPYATDIDRSGVTDSFDILELINLLNGAGAYDVYNEAELP
jgi:subtilisin family serine protease